MDPVCMRNHSWKSIVLHIVLSSSLRWPVLCWVVCSCDLLLRSQRVVFNWNLLDLDILESLRGYSLLCYVDGALGPCIATLGAVQKDISRTGTTIIAKQPIILFWGASPWIKIIYLKKTLQRGVLWSVMLQLLPHSALFSDDRVQSSLVRRRQSFFSKLSRTYSLKRRVEDYSVMKLGLQAIWAY